MEQDTADRPLSTAQACAFLYLLVPVALFFGEYVRAAIAVPACAFLAWAAGAICRRATWKVRAADAVLALAAVAWVALSGCFGGLALNWDWSKHLAVVNQLHQPGGLWVGDEALRYYLAWYLVPSLAPAKFGAIALGVWTAIGVALFFRMLVDEVGAGRAVIVFVAFSGADLIGTGFTRFQRGPEFHWEWWTGWITYDSNTTTLFWAPQHALPAWLGVMLVRRQQWVGLLLACCAFWSPLATIGLLPFALFYARRDTFVRWENWAALLVAVPLALYLGAGTQSLPASLAWNRVCDGSIPCFSWRSYGLFLLLEVAVVAAPVLLWRREPVVVVATAVLVLLPAYSLGSANELGMRASAPALAVLAIGLAKLLSTGHWLAEAGLVALVVGASTPLGEVARAINSDFHADPATSLSDVLAQSPDYRAQYLARPPAWLLRRPANATSAADS